MSKSVKSELCCINKGLGIEEIALCGGAAALSSCCEKTTCTLLQMKGLEKVAGPAAPC